MLFQSQVLPDRAIPHDTTASINLTVDNPILTARPEIVTSAKIGHRRDG
jgi:hypothetical protein